MSAHLSMTLEILLPFQVFARRDDVVRVVAETRQGSYGLLPRRLDCVAALEPGILTFETAAGEVVELAVDEGVLIKTGRDVVVAVRHAIGGADLDGLHAAVRREFVDVDDRERTVRATLARLESGLLRRFLESRRD